MKNLILRTTVILATAATMFYSGCGDNGASSDVRGGGNVDALINRTRGTNDPKTPDLYTLNVIKSPESGGSVSKSPDKEQYTSGESVLVSATPETGYRFAGWSGSQTSTNNEMTVTMNGNKELIANFAPQTYTLTINAANGGFVSSDPGKSAYTYNEQVTVTATAREGYEFTGWSGALSSTSASVTIMMNGNKELTAGFRQTGIVVPPSASYTLTVSASPANGGTVSTNPSKTSYSANENVYVTAEAAEGYKFIRWSSASASQNAGITIAMDGNKELIAIFEILTYTLTATATPSSYGSVSRDPNRTNYSHGTSVTVTATANNGYTFKNWTATGMSTVPTNATLDIVMTSDVTLTANFETTITTFNDTRDQRQYNKITINGQTWMAENLNYEVEGSKCYGEDDRVYDNVSWKTLTSAEVAANCAKYGRLYNWSTAMGIGASYNSTYWGEGDEKHQGVCPVGWHIPSDAEWSALENAVGGSSTAGTKLKSKTGWNSSGNGTDNYGWSALPGGSYHPILGFEYAGFNAYWWSATEYLADNDEYAWIRFMYSGHEYVTRSNRSKSHRCSVRCVQND